MGGSFLALGKPAAALSGYKQVLAMLPRALEALRGKARAELALGRLGDVLHTVATLPESDPERGPMIINVAAAAMQRAQAGDVMPSAKAKKRRLREDWLHTVSRRPVMQVS